MLRFLALSFARQPIVGGGDPFGELTWRHDRCRETQRLDEAKSKGSGLFDLFFGHRSDSLTATRNTLPDSDQLERR